MTALFAGLSLPGIFFGFVLPAGIFFLIVLAFKLLGVFIRFLREKSLERAYRREEERDRSGKN